MLILSNYVASYVKNYVCIKENAYQIADLVLNEYKRYINANRISDIERQLKDIDKQLDDIVDTMIANNKNTLILDKLNEKADDLTQQKEYLEKEFSKLKLALAVPHSRDDIVNHLLMFTDGDPNDFEYRRKVIKRLVKAVYLYDDKFILYLNLIDGQDVAFKNLTDIENAVKTAMEQEYDCENKSNLTFYANRSATTSKIRTPLSFITVDGCIGWFLLR